QPVRAEEPAEILRPQLHEVGVLGEAREEVRFLRFRETDLGMLRQRQRERGGPAARRADEEEGLGRPYRDIRHPNTSAMQRSLPVLDHADGHPRPLLGRGLNRSYRVSRRCFNRRWTCTVDFVVATEAATMGGYDIRRKHRTIGP